MDPDVRARIRRGVAIAATAQGRAHEARGAPCEDAVCTVEGPVTVAAVADGAGSARHAKRGAETAARAAVRLLRDDLAGLLRAGPSCARERVLEVVDGALAAEAARLGATPRDLASTLLFVAVRQGRFLAGHLGDGLVGIRRGGRVEVLSQPANGEHANETVFVPTRRGPGDLRLYTGASEGVDGFVLMTDGAADGLWGATAEHPTVRSPSSVLARWWHGLDVFPAGDVELALAESLAGPVREATRDDCGVAIVRTVGLGRLGTARSRDLLGECGRRALRTRGRVARAWSAVDVDAGIDVIARRARLHPSTVRRHLDKLRRLGWG